MTFFISLLISLKTTLSTSNEVPITLTIAFPFTTSYSTKIYYLFLIFKSESSYYRCLIASWYPWYQYFLIPSDIS